MKELETDLKNWSDAELALQRNQLIEEILDASAKLKQVKDEEHNRC